MLRTLFLVCFSFFFQLLYAKTDTLPQFTVTKKNNKITISWINNYNNTSQINIQRSKDSNRNYITIHSCPQPRSKTYTFTDPSATNDSMYYRIFLLFDDANYTFTKAKRPVEQKDVVTQTDKTEKTNTNTGKKEQAVNNQEKKDSSLNKEKQSSSTTTTQVKDSTRQKKTVQQKENVQTPKQLVLPDSIHLSYAKIERSSKNRKQFPYKKIKIDLAQNFIKPWQPSVFVYTGDDGNIVIDLPDATKSKYSIVFAGQEGRPLFSLPEIKETKLILDKVVFLKSGWYYFELRENGKVKERNRFLITRDY